MKKKKNAPTFSGIFFYYVHTSAEMQDAGITAGEERQGEAKK